MCAVALAMPAVAHRKPGPAAKSVAVAEAPQSAPKPAAHETDPLERVLYSMDENAAKFRTAQANFVWKTYNSVVGDITETDKGKIYFRRSGSNLFMSARFTDPPSKQVVFTGGTVKILQPGGQVDEYDTAAHRAEVETFLVLGFGSSGQDLRKSFDLRDLGQEKIGSIQTEKLELIPKAANVKTHVPKIVLWMDPARGLSMQQQIFEQSGDYRLAEYSSIELNQKVPEDVFKLKAGAKMVVRH
jgi:outer membrane lipoprotein-sorting protein